MAFPAILRALIEMELAAGNSITEVGHGFPAPPAGAYFKLAHKVTARPHDSSGGLEFQERNNSGYSGVFTDEKRFYFVLEPPNPPEPEPDMDAIRKELELQPTLPGQPGKEPPTGLNCTETATSAKRVLHFQDTRPPQEIQFALELSLMVLFTPMEDGKLIMAAKPKVNGQDYQMALHFEAALPASNCYSLHVETTWEGQPEANHDYYRKSSAGWFSFWTRDLKGASPPPANAGSTARYKTLCDTAKQAEAHLDTVPALQQQIVGAMKQGAFFSTSDKEGDTRIVWNDGRFFRIRTGDDPGQETYASEEAFLKSLRMFYDWETSASIYPEKVPEIDAWKLILRLLRTR